jgi:hypothetical protein
MATPTKWSSVAVAMQSLIDAAKTITGISKANPGVLTSAAHGFANGDLVYLVVNGMHQLNGKVVRVAAQATNTFELEGVDTTLFDTFASGTVQKLTMGTSITTATTITAAGGDFGFIDTTTIHANQRSQIPDLPNAATFTMDNIWDVADAGLLAMKAASDAQAIRAFGFTFPNGRKMYFAGYVGASLLPGGQAQGLVTTQSVITMFGTPTYY